MTTTLEPFCKFVNVTRFVVLHCKFMTLYNVCTCQINVLFCSVVKQDASPQKNTICKQNYQQILFLKLHIINKRQHLLFSTCIIVKLYH